MNYMEANHFMSESDCCKKMIDANDDIHVMHDEDIMREIHNLRT